MDADTLEAELAALEPMALAQLRSKWSKLTGKPVPKISAGMLHLALVWQLQARVHGGLSRQTLQKLDQFEAGRTITRTLRPGMRLVREWNGTLHVVTIEEDGSILWNNQHWPSLSKIARAITGTRWSGPAFFGLKQRNAA